MEQKKANLIKIISGVAVLAAGIIINLLNLGSGMFGFVSVGDYVIYIGLIMLATTALNYKKKRAGDERAVFINYKATRITFAVFIIACLAIIIVDGIKPITLEYKYFLGYLVGIVTLFHLITYKVIEKKN